jgi:hypothetical protein
MKKFDPVVHATLIFLLAFLLYVGMILMLESLTNPHISGPRKIFVAHNEFTDANLRQWYAGFNESKFYGELPDNTEVVWADLREFEAMGMTVPEGPGFKIELDPHYIQAPTTAQETLIHEMCHVEDSYVEHDDEDSFTHGPKWEACMIRVAVHGGFRGIW